MMRTNWSVFRRRIKTPLHDYIQLREIAPLILTARTARNLNDYRNVIFIEHQY